MGLLYRIWGRTVLWGDETLGTCLLREEGVGSTSGSVCGGGGGG